MWGLIFTCILGSSTLVDQIVAVVDKEVITESELLIEARVALVWRGGEAVATVDLDQEALSGFLDLAINQRLIAAQARRLATVDVTSAEIDARLLSFSQRFSSTVAYRAFLRRWGVSEAGLRDLTARQILNDKYIAQRMRTRALQQLSHEEELSKWLIELRGNADILLLNDHGKLLRVQK